MLLQAGLEGEPTWKTPRVPPAQSPGITPLAHEADSHTSTTQAAPASLDALRLDAFVHNYVESIVSKAKSELVAEELHSTTLKGDTPPGAPATPGSLAFTQGSSAGSTVSPHKGRSGSGPAKAGPHRAQHRPLYMPLSPHVVSASKQQQQGPDVVVSSSTQAARSLQLHGSSQKDAQQEGQWEDALLSSLQAPAVSEGQAPHKDKVVNGSDGQGGWQLTGDGVAETASADEPSGKDELLPPRLAEADADATRMVSEIVQEILQAVSERTHADQVSNVDLTVIVHSECMAIVRRDVNMCRSNTVHRLCCMYLWLSTILPTLLQSMIRRLTTVMSLKALLLLT